MSIKGIRIQALSENNDLLYGDPYIYLHDKANFDKCM